ncbi:MAG: radical SAM family heme chaperone HemW [Anaerotignaceae bacterium]
MNDLSLYIHIPFCKKKCLYCDFPSFADSEPYYEDYTKALVNEIIGVSKEASHKKVKSIFIGGGTPTAMPSKLIGKIMDTVLNNYNVCNNAEITIEANPQTVDRKYLTELKAMDFNRISFGVQAWQNSHLQTLGRIHTNETFVINYNEAREVGFKNINCDVMFSLPNQTILDWEETLEKIMKLNPEHISAYSLIVEEGTPFKEKFDKGLFKPIDEKLDREMYYLLKEMTKDKGYIQYEISNFAKDSYESVHNIRYWETREYLGFGLGAHSYFEGNRFNNKYSLKDYISLKGNFVKLRENIEALEEKQKIEEFMFMGLRMNKGIDFSEFKHRFKTDINDIYKKEIEELEDLKLVIVDKDKLFLTEKGFDLSNVVFEKFII